MSRSSILFSKLTNCNVLLLLLVFISSLSRAFLTIDVLYWAVGPLMLLIICKNLNQGFKDYSLRIILFFLIAFSLWCAISAFWSIAPFTTLARSVWFMVIAVGGVMMGWQSRNSERTWFSAGSFIAGIILIASILSLTLRIPGDNWSGGNAMGFKGCSVHQNTLGAVIITMLPFSIFELSRILKLPLSALFDRSETSTNGIEWNSLFVHGLIITGNIYVLFLTHSRGAILVFFVFTFLFIILSLRRHRLLWLTTIIGAILVFISVLNYCSPASREYLLKGERYFGNYRSRILTQSIVSAEKGGWCGLGFGMTDPSATAFTRLKEGVGASYLGREKSVSSLALIEEVGVGGFCLFMIPLAVAAASMLRRKKDIVNLFLISYLAMLVFHAQIEGWWVGVGSYQLPFFYFALGAMVKRKSTI